MNKNNKNKNNNITIKKIDSLNYYQVAAG